ncbi:MAG: hypothetical protein COB66_04760 [Coxiella sp. (in: Bacteria)]|nr:MAG: hypothetical protein COB66_04760 [Coxiella sp. (in: g-proteobacteria)]
MNKFTNALVASLVLVTSITFAAKEGATTIKLYAAPDFSKVLATIPVNANLTSIIQKKDWVKVGDRTNGQVGWINTKQYRKAREAYDEPNIQTVYVNATENNEGKPTVNIIAYKNGKKLSDKEAKLFYKKMLKQQRIEQLTQRSYWRHANQMMRRQQQDMNQLLNDNFSNDDMRPVILMPGPVIMPKQPAAQEKTDTLNSKKVSAKVVRKRFSV